MSNWIKGSLFMLALMAFVVIPAVIAALWWWPILVVIYAPPILFMFAWMGKSMFDEADDSN